MSILTVFFVGFVAAFPVLLILANWRMMRRRLPWVGLLISLAAVILFWLFVVYILLPGPQNCQTTEACNALGFDIFLATTYSILIFLVALAASILLRLYYDKKVWKKGEKALKTGKVPFFIIMIVVLGIAGYFAVATSVVLTPK